MQKLNSQKFNLIKIINQMKWKTHKIFKKKIRNNYRILMKRKMTKQNQEI